MAFTEREQVVEIINRLFYYTDCQLWDKLIEEVFTEKVLFDITSLGAEKSETLKREEICAVWKEGLEGLDAVHHQAGNYMIEIAQDIAKVKAYSIASHYKKEATNGTTREFIGSYDLSLIKSLQGWRINEFKFNLKYMTGNLELT
jgi:hypothetical protein